MFIDVESMTRQQLRNELLRSKEVLRQMMGRYEGKEGKAIVTAYFAVAECERSFRPLVEWEEANAKV